MNDVDFDITLIGGGVVGLAICFEISQLLPKLKILLIEKEKKMALSILPEIQKYSCWYLL